ncbi:flavin monoamine oxidase family protein [Mycobacterium kansasii]|uniref:flavin monoamine oxidase family protein n=1 Tax=Mycobacterium persicum TaxID=1487726 RepID=UPI001301CDA9|nr:NAD(P)/FAD-dependent oxidoreductase [Mycobacterium persicum]
MAHHQSDFCAVGAVYAGLTAAYRIHQAGHSVTVFEAGPRGGGRTWSAKLSNGALFEIDGQWVGDEDAQPDVRRLMDEFGIEVYGQWDRGKTVFVDLKNNIHTYDAHDANPLIALPPISMAAKLDLSKAILSMEKMSEVVNPEAPWDDVRFPFTVSLGPGTTREADQMTVQSWFNLNIMTKEARALLGAAIVGYTGVELAACSLLHWLFVLKIYRSKLFNMSGQAPGQAQQYRVRGGMQQMADRIVATLGPEAVHLNSPVRQITQDANGVTVSAENVAVRARRVIVATNISMTNFIHFDPILPPDRAQLQHRVPTGAFWKIWLCYDEAFWRRRGLVGESISIYPGDYSPNARECGFDESSDRPGLMSVFLAGDKARDFNHLTRAERKAQVLKEMSHRFGADGGQLSERIHFPAVSPQNPAADSYFEFNWSMDEWTRGDFAGCMGPGVWTGHGFGPAVREPVGRVHWAGVDTSTYPYHCVSGAAQSGERAAREVLAAD